MSHYQATSKSSCSIWIMCDIAVLKDEHNKFNAEYMKNEKSIHQLIEEQEIDCKTFLVPSYQRGYRWQRVNVSDLLNDLYEFIHSDKETYSLQPLIVYDSNDNIYHVVDGQQRLTTISILLGYLNSAA